LKNSFQLRHYSEYGVHTHSAGYCARPAFTRFGGSHRHLRSQ
jgi:hypothetical protein